jgi:hypothetical protein
VYYRGLERLLFSSEAAASQIVPRTALATCQFLDERRLQVFKIQLRVIMAVRTIAVTMAGAPSLF